MRFALLLILARHAATLVQRLLDYLPLLMHSEPELMHNRPALLGVLFCDSVILASLGLYLHLLDLLIVLI